MKIKNLIFSQFKFQEIKLKVKNQFKINKQKQIEQKGTYCEAFN